MALQKQLLFIVTFALLLGNLFTFGFLYMQAAHIPAGRAPDSAQASFCINHAPEITVPCNATLGQNTAYYCALNVSDVDGGTLIVTQIPGVLQILNLTTDGIINFTPNQTQVGNHTVTFYVADSSGCLRNSSSASFNFSVFNVNDAPYLSRTIPDVSFTANTTLNAFFLVDYFTDTDGDLMNFSSTLPAGITITILPTSEVIISSNVCNEAGELVTFTATDPYNASGDSNAITVSVVCATSSSSGGGSSGSGGGGGGGSTSSCRENWQCEEWFACLPAGLQWRRCWDKGGCENDEYQKRACIFAGPPITCQENWLCEEWGKCRINATQVRNCNDLSLCSSTLVRPPLTQACNYQPTCNDGVWNGEETATDCGGSLCPACALVQQPSVIDGDGGIPTWLLILILLCILLVSGVAHYYRAQIAQGMAQLGFLLHHHGYKDILLDTTQRRSLFERMREFEDTMQKKTPARMYASLADLMRSYIAEALVLHMEMLPEEVAATCKELKLRRETTSLMVGLIEKVALLEQVELELNEYFVQATLEELRTMVCLTSDFTQDELLRPVEEIPISDKMSFYDEIFARTANAMRATQFGQLEIARKEYLTILTRYDPLSVQEKDQIYPQLRWTYEAVKFRGDVTGAKIVKKPEHV